VCLLKMAVCKRRQVGSLYIYKERLLRKREYKKTFRVNLYCTVKPILVSSSLDQHKETSAQVMAIPQTSAICCNKVDTFQISP